MATKKAAKKTTTKSEKRPTGDRKSAEIFSAEERAAMREHVQEMKRSRQSGGAENEEDAVLEKLRAMPAADRAMGERLHTIIKAAALSPKLWYGMPAYAKDGNVVCFFQNAGKFKARYSTLGFSDKAHLDDGTMWPTSFALTQLTSADEATITALVKRAVG